MDDIYKTLFKAAEKAKASTKKVQPAAKPKPAPVKKAATPAPVIPGPEPVTPFGLAAQAQGAGLNFGGMTQQGVGTKNTKETGQKNFIEDKTGNKVRVPGQYAIDPQTFADLIALQGEVGPSGLVNQDRAMKDLEETIGRLSQAPLRETDLRPLAAGLDNLFGFNFSKTAQAPYRQEDRDRELAAAQADLAKLYNEQAKTQVGTLNAQILDSPGFIETTGGGIRSTTDTQGTQSTQTATAATPAPRRGSGAGKELDTRPFADRLQKDGIIEMKGILGRINSHIPGGINKWNGSDLPGFGRVTGTLNRLSGGVFAGDNGALIQEVQAFNNAVMKARSGGTITDNEAQRLSLELGTGLLKDSKALVQALRGSALTLDEMIANRARGEKPGVLEAYLQRGQNPNIDVLQTSLGGAPAPGASPTTGAKRSGADLLRQMKARQK